MYRAKYYKYKAKYLEIKQHLNRSQSGGGEITKLGDKVRTVSYNEESMSGGPERKLEEIGAAGIVPYDVDSSGKLYILLGFDPHRTQKKWKVFGGGKDKGDNNSRDTAFREAKEESCRARTFDRCYLPIKQDFLSQMHNPDDSTVVVPKYGPKFGSWYNYYFMKLDREGWIRKHGGDDVEVPHNYVQANEVSRIKWFSEDEVAGDGSISRDIRKLVGVHGDEIKGME